MGCSVAQTETELTSTTIAEGQILSVCVCVCVSCYQHCDQVIMLRCSKFCSDIVQHLFRVGQR